MRTRGKTLEESFWARTNKAGDNDCWLWSGSKNHHGYGKFGGMRATHISLLLHTGEKPDYVMHLCDNPTCVNPAHLRQSSHTENMLDKVAKGRSRNQYTDRTHCKKGHEYTEGNYFIYQKRGRSYRHCRECHNAPRRKP